MKAFNICIYIHWTSLAFKYYYASHCKNLGLVVNYVNTLVIDIFALIIFLHILQKLHIFLVFLNANICRL